MSLALLCLRACKDPRLRFTSVSPAKPLQFTFLVYHSFQFFVPAQPFLNCVNLHIQDIHDAQRTLLELEDLPLQSPLT